jgi:peptide/nickel transport system permease protein
VSSGWLVRRFGQMVLVAFGVALLVFLLLRLVPGDPAATVLGSRATPEAIEALHVQWGLDRPLPEQFVRFLGQVVRGDLGDSLVYQEPVSRSIAQRIEPTIWLFCMGSLFAMAISVPLATLAAARKDKLSDHLVRAVPLLGFAMPAVWVGLMLILVFSLTLGWFPVGGFGEGTFGHLRAMVLPALTVALILSPVLIRSLRASLIETLEADYIATARSKGLPERRVIARHALRNAAISSVTVFAVNVVILIGNLVVVERVYAIPGLGTLLIDAVLGRDFPIVQGVVLCLALFVLVIFLLTDVLLALLDPRVRFR